MLIMQSDLQLEGEKNHNTFTCIWRGIFKCEKPLLFITLVYTVHVGGHKNGGGWLKLLVVTCHTSPTKCLRSATYPRLKWKCNKLYMKLGV